MRSATDNPPPDLSFLEQIGAWLDTFSAVPPWLAWALVWITIGTAVGIPVVMFVWRVWAADWWAIRSRNGAELRAKKLGMDIINAHQLSRNRPAMLFHAVQAIISLIFASMLVTIMVSVGMNLHGLDKGQPPSELLITGRKSLSLFSAASAYLGFFLFILIYRRLLPLADLDKYTRKSMTRIKGLFAKARVPDDVAAKRLKSLDTFIDKARQEEIK